MTKFRNKAISSLITLMLLCGMALDTMAASAGRKNNDFGTNGVLTSSTATGQIFFNDLAASRNANDNFVAVGGRNGDFWIQSAGPNQFGSIDFGGTEVAYAVASRRVPGSEDSQFVIVGDTNNGSSTSIVLAGVITDFSFLSIDPTFGTNGKVTTTIPNRSVVGFDVAIDSMQRIIVCGRILGGANTDAVFVRYNSNGSIDTTFGTNGIAVIDDGGNANLALTVIIEPNTDKIIAGGLSGNNFAVYKLNFNGSLDTGFGGDGIVSTTISGSSRVNGIAQQTNGKITVGGSSDSNANAAFARYTANGTLDTTFGNNGIAIINKLPTGTEAVTNISIPSGTGADIYASLNSTNGGTGVLKLLTNGTPDVGFGNGGLVRHTADGNSCTSIINYKNKLYLTTNDSTAIQAKIVSLALTPIPTQSNDFDGDGFSDHVIFRPSTATWFILRSSDQEVEFRNFGVNGDVPIDGDFDGDGKSDTAIYRPSVGEWWITRSSDGSNYALQFGATGDKPVAGDYDKDGKTDIAFWRPSNGNYYVLRSSDNFASFYGLPFGANGDIPVGTAIYP